MEPAGERLRGSWELHPCCTPAGPNGQWAGPPRDPRKCSTCFGTRRRAFCTICAITNCDGKHDFCIDCLDERVLDCPDCGGEGTLSPDDEDDATPCPRCGGERSIPCPTCAPASPAVTQATPGDAPRPSEAARPAPGSAWTQLAAATTDLEPESDARLMGWMAGEAAGMASYAEAVTGVHETAVNTTGLDPAGMQALHDYAGAAAEAASAMAGARARFAAHYQAVREFIARGGVLPRNGRWITGEGG